MVDFSQKIKDLEGKLKSYALRLKTISEASLKLESENKQEIQTREKELEE